MNEATTHEIASHGVAAPGKARNGDACGHRELADEDLVVLVVADGVSSRPSDWKASDVACEVVLSGFAQQSGSLEARLVRAVTLAHENVTVLDGEHRGAQSTLVVAVWRRGEDVVRYVNVGDSRLHEVHDGGVRALTTDDAKDIVIRRDGEVTTRDGAVGTARGITNALGPAAPPRIVVQEAPFPAGGTLALTTDGCHGMPGFVTRMVALHGAADLASALPTELFVNWPVEDQDDATIVVLRRRRFSAALRERATAALLTGEAPESAGVPRHMMARHVVDHMRGRLAAGDTASLEPALAYLRDNQLRPGRERLVAVLDAFVDDGQAATHQLFRQLVDLARGN